MQHIDIRCLTLATTLVCSGCGSVGEDYQKPETDAGSAPTWSGRLKGAISAADLDPELLARWWTTLNDATLTSLVERASSANLDLRTARAQLRRARAERKLAEAGQAPRVGASGTAMRTGNPAGSSPLYSGGLDASWELDLFGGITRGIEAAEADLQAMHENRRDVLVTVLAEVALNYTDLRTDQRRRLIAQSNLRSQQEHLDIVIAKEKAGSAIQLDVDRARSNVESTRSTIPALDQQIQQVKNRLAVLIGKKPGAIDAELLEVRVLMVPSVRVAIGVPAQVLRRRPDVRGSERRLAAETARVGVAIADLYPKFTFSGTIGLESPSFSQLFKSSSRTFGFGPGVKWNVFDGGATRQRIEIQNAVQEEALVNYERSILTALEDVENAITAFTQEQLRRHSLKIAADSAASAEKLAVSRHKAGFTDYLSVLDAQRTRLAAEDEVVSSEGRIVSNLIRLYKALGGGWNPEEPPTKKND